LYTKILISNFKQLASHLNPGTLESWNPKNIKQDCTTILNHVTPNLAVVYS
jgi:hypothetical protein